MTKKKLIQVVKAELDNVGHGIFFDVITAGVRQEETWWYVPVLAIRRGKDVPRDVTVNVFANVEDELEENQNVSVLLIPAVAEDEPVKASGGNRRGK